MHPTKPLVAVALALSVAALPSVAAAQPGATPEPSTGVDFAPRKGLSLEVQGGGFFAFAGAVRGYSNFQPYGALSLGFDLGSVVTGLSGFASVAYGPNAGDCRSGTTTAGGSSCAQWNEPAGVLRRAPEDFSMLPVEAGVRYRFTEILPRFSAYGMFGVGATILTPQVAQNASAIDPHVGLGGGVNFDTQLDGLSLGAELFVRAAFAPLIPSLAVYPRIRYTF